MRTPELLTATQRAARLKLTGRAPAEGEAPITPNDSSEPSLDSKQVLDRTQVRETFGVDSPPSASAASDLLPQADLSFSLLEIDDLEEYRLNPRTGLNPCYDEIKASIRADGITNMLTVTRRPGASRYSPYGGGNTRLRIARELFQEGDQRFARLNVLVKSWPGEAAVISAHLAENENRGDISFWEKAQGVASFQREFESSTGRKLAANELNKELKRLGLSYGIRMIQNFAFAVENLEPIGPWLRSREVNTSVRPGVSSYIEIGERLDKTVELREGLQRVLTQRHNQLVALQQRNDERDENEQIAVELDADALLEELQDAAAAALGVASSSIPLMASALVQNPHIDADSLCRIRAMPVASPQLLKAGSATPSPQIPLGGMLAPVLQPDGSAHRAADGPVGDQPNPALTSQTTSSAPGRGQASEQSLQRDLREIYECMLALNELVPIYDMLNTVPSMPFGFLCDFPPNELNMLEGQPLPQPAADYRVVLWKLLVILSGQLQHDLSMALMSPDSSLRWVHAIAEGPEAFAETVLTKGHSLYKNGDIFAAGIEVAMLFEREDVGTAVLRLLSTLQQFRLRYPQRFPAQRVPLFSKP